MTYKYICFGKEVGDSGTPHLQGYISFVNARTLGQVQAMIAPISVHWSKAKGNAEQNKEYCSKDGDFYEDGEMPVSNKKKGELEKERWAKALQAAKEGRYDDIDDDIRFRYYSTCKQIYKDYMIVPSDNDGVTGVWIYGPAGVGKSRKARDDYPNAYLKMCNKWWDGYQDQEFVIIDDIDTKHHVLGHHLKIWADRYAFLAENKGGAVALRPKKIIVTSQYSIDEIWEDQETRAALKRRFEVIHLIGLQGSRLA